MEDALQEAAIKAYRALPAFKSRSGVGTWLYRILYNTCLDSLRRRSGPLEQPAPLEEQTVDPDPTLSTGSWRGSDSTPPWVRSLPTSASR